MGCGVGDPPNAKSIYKKKIIIIIIIIISNIIILTLKLSKITYIKILL